MQSDTRKRAIFISGFGWFDERLEPVSEVLEEKGYDVEFYLSDYSHIYKSYIEHKNPRCNYLHVPAYKKNVSVGRIISHMVFGHKIKNVLRKKKPDLIYSLLPPNSVGPPCLAYKKQNSECKYFVDIIDMWPGYLIPRLARKVEKNTKNSVVTSVMRGGWRLCNWILQKWASMRNDSVAYANHVFLECNLYKEELTKYIDDNTTTTLYLFKVIDDADRVLRCINERRLSYKKDKIVLGYLGSINHVIDIDRICEVLSELVARNVSVEFRIVGVGESKDKLILAAKQTGASVKYYGRVFDRNEKLEILGGCDYGFNIMKSDVTVGLTIKSVDYFSMGIPIINGIQGDTWDFVSRENIGVNLEGDYIDRILDMTEDRGSKAFECFMRCFTRKAFQDEVRKALREI